jgi:hypothetical protein
MHRVDATCAHGVLESTTVEGGDCVAVAVKASGSLSSESMRLPLVRLKTP